MHLIFVFGSNTQGRHGKGAALEALNTWGAIYGTAAGRQGNSYGIITKELRPSLDSITLEQIREQTLILADYMNARLMTHTFLITRFGSGLAGHPIDKLKPLWDLLTIKPNGAMIHG